MNTNTKREGDECPVCGEGHLSDHVGKNEVEYNGISREIDYHFSTCDTCGSDIASNAQSKTNVRIMNAFKKEVDRILSGKAIREFRQRFSLSQEQCAELFGGGTVAFSRYEKDDVSQSSSMDKLLRLCMKYPANIAFLSELAHIPLTDATQSAIREDIEAKIREFAKIAQKEIDKRNAPARPRIRLVSINSKRCELTPVRDFKSWDTSIRKAA